MASPVTTRQTSPLLIAAAWIVVILPASWGLRYTVQNALKLFTTPAAATPTAATPAAGTPAQPSPTTPAAH